MLHRLRLAVQSGSTRKFGAHVELDETFNGRQSPEHALRQAPAHGHHSGQVDGRKMAVMGLLERHGEERSEIRLAQIPSNKCRHLMSQITAHRLRSNVHNDSLPSNVATCRRRARR
jgi:hypothetical protein